MKNNSPTPAIALLQMGKIYFIKCKTEDNFIKIGFAVDPKLRVIELQRGCPYELELVREIRAYMWQEKWLHSHFKQKHVRGEWFIFDPIMLEIEPPEQKPEYISKYINRQRSKGLTPNFDRLKALIDSRFD